MLVGKRRAATVSEFWWDVGASILSSLKYFGGATTVEIIDLFEFDITEKKLRGLVDMDSFSVETRTLTSEYRSKALIT